MRKAVLLYITGLLMINTLSVISQISEGGLPPSFGFESSLRSSVKPAEISVDLYIKDMVETDNWRARQGGLLRIAQVIPADFSIDKSGDNTTLPDGQKIWRLSLKARDAKAIMLYYSDFYIPEGGRLFIYNAEKTQILGAYTHKTNPAGGLFATEFVGGEELTLEYVYPAASPDGERPRISINSIGYGYNESALKAFTNIRTVTTRSISDECEVDINCEEGDAWQNEKRGVCWMNQRIGNSGYICTGSAVNNTAEDFKPLILSAHHCSADGDYNGVASSSDMNQWIFYFNREFESCKGSIATTSKTMVGCHLLAYTSIKGQSDGLLLELNQPIPDEYNVYYNGWDRRAAAANSGVSIHHPSGDYKKISTFSSPATTATFNGEVTCDVGAHWNVRFVATTNGHGVTEGGSSGSPLFNENKLVVGTLTGGNSQCIAPNGLNLYGKLYNHWNKYKTDTTQTSMDIWLDPLNTGVETLQGRYSRPMKPTPANLTVTNLGSATHLEWQAPEGGETPLAYRVYRNNRKITETSVLFYEDTEPEQGALTYSVSALYPDDIESSAISTTILFIKYKAPTDLKAERLSSGSNAIHLTWKKPVYEQTVYWGSMKKNRIIGLRSSGNFVPFYFGQQWSANEISGLNKKTIQAIQFIPIPGNQYEIIIRQSDYAYRQSILKIFKDTTLKTIDLQMPFVIDDTKDLIVGLSVVYATTYSAIMDDVSAVDGRGNMLSENGIDWVSVLEEFPTSGLNNNFIVAAVISSEEGELTAKSSAKEPKRILSKSDLSIQSSAEPESRASNMSVRSSQPAPFPEVTRYRIDRSDKFLQYVDAPTTEYTDNNPLNDYYTVSAMYGDVPSEPSNRADVSVVSNESAGQPAGITPTRFSAQVYLSGSESVARVDILSVSGSLCLSVSNPGSVIDASSLPAGLYFFRLYLKSGESKTVRAVKF